MATFIVAETCSCLLTSTNICCVDVSFVGFIAVIFLYIIFTDEGYQNFLKFCGSYNVRIFIGLWPSLCCDLSRRRMAVGYVINCQPTPRNVQQSEDVTAPRRKPEVFYRLVYFLPSRRFPHAWLKILQTES